MATVLLLGATSDIAVAMAKKFASEKYDIILAARNPLLLAATESDLKIRYQVNVISVAFDAVKYQTHAVFFSSLNPKPDISITMFGILEDEEPAFENWEAAERMINTNYTGAVSVLNIIARQYITDEKGTIIGISSVAGDRGRASKLVYASAKAGFSTYLAGLRNKCFKHKVHVMTVKPGFVYTKMTENVKLPRPITSTPAEVAEIIYSAYLKKKNVVYVKWFWKYIMMIIQAIPEFQFKKMKL